MPLEFRKLGVIFDPAESLGVPDWMNGFAQAPNAVDMGSLLRVYFCTRGKPDHENMYISRLGFVDLDRETLSVKAISQEPCLSLGGLGEFDEFGTYPVSVLKCKKQMLAAYGGWTRCESVPFNISIGMSSSDLFGMRFQKFGNGPVLAPYLDEPHTITSPKLRFFKDLFVMTYTAGHKWILDDRGTPEIIYKLRIAFSDDLIRWRRLGKNIISDQLGPDEAQACGDIVFKDGLYHMFFCFRKSLDFRSNPENSYRLGYAYSSDLENWIREDKYVAALQPSEFGWDYQMVAYPNVINIDGRWLVFYGGNGNGKTGFGAAEILGF